MPLEIARRLIDGIWRTASADESGGGGGGSQTVRVVGPFHFDFTDFPTEDTTIELFTPTAGDWILRGFIDQATGVVFNDSGSIDFSLGEAPDFNASSVPGTFWGMLGPTGDPSDAAPNSDNPDSAIFLIGYRSTGLPLKIRAQSVVGDGSAGEMDLYFMVATPTAP